MVRFTGWSCWDSSALAYTCSLEEDELSSLLRQMKKDRSNRGWKVSYSLLMC